LYKACLFLTTGVVDHETGTRDITQLAGLGKVMLPIAIAAGLAALSSAGIPFTWGFIGKDLVYAALVHGEVNAVTLTVLAVVTNIFLSYSGYLAGIYPFIGKLPERLKNVHLPPALMWLPPVLLAVCGILFGIMPSLVDKS